MLVGANPRASWRIDFFCIFRRSAVVNTQGARASRKIRNRKPPSPSWRAFLDNHIKDMVAIDFFAVPTAKFRILFTFVVLRHDRRRVVHLNFTAHPTAEWTTQLPFRPDGIFGMDRG